MKKIIFILIIINFILFSCNSEDITKIQDIKKFITVFEKAIKNRDKKTLKKIIDKNFDITFNEILEDGQQKRFEGKKGIDNLNFELIEKILKQGYYEPIKGKRATSPPLDKQKFSHVIYFINRGDGWRILGINAMTGGLR